ncbi:MAG: rRNA maturation RNase YbeY [Betaproteobacteria bacterium]|nr:MAG: rRNA maturation RNase YbeY [Betaproteobacteria bacterium]TAG48779.1 MAG: rRNA maturation RNase YbeY [Betaproteobacteria bacterium]
MTLSISVQYASKSANLPARAQVRRWALAAHNGVGDGDAVVTIRYVDKAEGRSLNAQFRGKDYATNVLTFASDAATEPAFLQQSTPRKKPRRSYSADIVICAPVVIAESKSQRKLAHAHHAHMVIHGMLHAQGFDHENDAEATVMEAIEINTLQRFRINNPYES